MTEEMPKVYNPTEVEKQADKIWNEHKSFNAEPSGKDKNKSYCIVIPPPNVTAPLHLGHALNNTLQDILIRFRRMQQYNTLWMPGTDHAGIATQTVVEKRLIAEEGKKRTDFAREEFVARVQSWKDEYEARIISQLKAMGCSCDWRRVRFTMDEVCARAVRAAFFKLFRDGLIYRGKRLVNWDPATQTVLADDEVEHETVQGFFWYLKYPLVSPVVVNGEEISFVTVATTRPETMLGDTAVAMNPRDPRAEKLVGSYVRLPIVGRVIPIVADEHVVLPDAESKDEKARYSTGFLKVTPAHDPDDWAIGQRHDLAIINIMAPDGSISDKYGWDDSKEPEAQQFIGMDRFEAREAIVEWFRQEKLLEKVVEYSHEVGHSYRSHVPIEPYLSDQWYIAVKKPVAWLAEKFGEGLIEGTDVPVNSLAGLALKPLLDEKLRFIPARYARNYQGWLENLRDWPVSRQLWWGHQIPIWSKAYAAEGENTIEALQKQYGSNVVFHLHKQDYVSTSGTENPNDNQESNEVIYACVAEQHPELEEKLEQQGFVRDPDVLDTWFSSSLWPFSTLGWPEQTPELETYYPGDVLCTAREIITLWVSRMVMMGQYCVGDIPFKDVFIHAMIQDGQGRKMSKSLGNGIDPLVAIDSHGADAMRFALAGMTTQTQDVRMPVEPVTLPDGRKVNSSLKFDLGRNFCNKLWNASRFVLGNLSDISSGDFSVTQMRLEDRWILSGMTRAVQITTEHLEAFKYSEPVNRLQHFFWNEFCDWYLELVKPRMKDDTTRPQAQRVLALVLDAVLRLLHPFIPFITEGIYQRLNTLLANRDIPGLAELGVSQTLVQAQWPDINKLNGLIDTEAEEQMAIIQTAIKLIRDIRTRYQVPPRKGLDVTIKANSNVCRIISAQRHLISNMAGVAKLVVGQDSAKPTNAASVVSDKMELYVEDVIDVEAERKRLLKQKELLEKGIKTSQAKLGNENFVNRAKPEIVERERSNLARLQEQYKGVVNNLNTLPSQ